MRRGILTVEHSCTNLKVPSSSLVQLHAWVMNHDKLSTRFQRVWLYRAYSYSCPICTTMQLSRKYTTSGCIGMGKNQFSELKTMVNHVK